MLTLYVSQQGCYVCQKQELLLVKKGETVQTKVQLPLLEQILIFGQSQVTTQAIRTCLKRNIPIAYLSRMGRCYGRLLPIDRGYRHLARYQQQLTTVDRLIVARNIVQAKLKNSRVILQRQQRRRPSDVTALAIKSLGYLLEKAGEAETWERLMGLEGSAASQYFSAFGESLTNPDFIFAGRSRRPPGNPTNALLSFGYQVLWNHLLSPIECRLAAKTPRPRLHHPRPDYRRQNLDSTGRHRRRNHRRIAGSRHSQIRYRVGISTARSSPPHRICDRLRRESGVGATL